MAFESNKLCFWVVEVVMQAQAALAEELHARLTDSLHHDAIGLVAVADPV